MSDPRPNQSAFGDVLLTDHALAAMFDARKSAEIDAAVDGKPPNWHTRLEIEREAMRAAISAASDDKLLSEEDR